MKVESARHLNTYGSAGARLIPAFAPNWGFFLDIDGTLVDLAERPDAVRVDAALQTILRRLLEVTSGAVALISGRPIADVDRLFAPLRLPVAGQHGLERRDAAGNIHVHAAPADRLRSAAAMLARLTAEFPELVFEDKRTALAVHYRRAPSLAPYVDSVMRGLLAELGSGFELLSGKMLIEIKLGGKDKGTAIAEFMRENPFRGREPVFIGDDVTDEYGFALVNGLHGHAVKVGAGATRARWRLADAAAVRAWLTAYAEQHSTARASGQP